MTATTKDPLAPYREKGKAPAPVAATDKTPYVAFSPAREEKRFLECRFKFPAPADAYLNVELTSVLTEWRLGMTICLAYQGRRTIELRGERLTELARSIKDWKVEWVAEFDPQMHTPPTDPEAPFIESITITTERPADPPPMNQRH